MAHPPHSTLAAFTAFVRAHRLGPVAAAVANRLWRSRGGYARLFATEHDLARRQETVLDQTLVAMGRGTYLRDRAAELSRWADDLHPRVPRRVGQDADAIVVLAAQREALLAQIPAFTDDLDTAMELARLLDRLFTAGQELLMQVFYEARREDAEQIAQLAAELAEEKSFFKRLVELAPVAITYVDPALRVRWLNPVALRWLRLQADQAEGRSMEELLGTPASENLARALQTGEDVCAIEVRWDVPGGAPMYLDLAYAPMHGPGHQVDGVLVLAVDVTARVASQLGAAAKIRALEDLDRLKSNFINAASHELRTPLSAILGFAEFLEDELGGPLTPQQREFVCEIQAGTRRLQRLVDDLLDFARVEAGSFQLVWRPADLVELVREEASSLRPQALGKQIEVELDLPKSPVRLPVDAMRVGQVLLNLLTNALKFTPPHGRVRVSVSDDDTEVTVTVQDNGIGIPPEHLPRVFQKFFQVDPSSTRSHGGAGLGLAISKAIVEAHGGRIGVLSQPGSGSTFWFTLPKMALKIQEPASRATSDHERTRTSDV